MLIKCPECNQEVSDKAAACPHCGSPTRAAPPTAASEHASKRRRSSLFLIISFVTFVFALGAPRFLFPMFALGAICLAMVSLFRKERLPIGGVMIVLLTIGLAFVGNGPSLDTTERAVSYMVTGTAESASLTYNNAQGGTQQEKVRLPWDASLLVRSGTFLYISAQNDGEHGTVTVKILVDGQELKSSTASGAYKIASASGSCCR